VTDGRFSHLERNQDKETSSNLVWLPVSSNFTKGSGLLYGQGVFHHAEELGNQPYRSHPQ
jgi:hypothetical protein